MNELIKVAEELYKQIDELQRRLASNLSDDDNGTLLRTECFMLNIINHKDNIVDLSEVWHYKDQEPPEIGRYILADTPQCGILLMFTHTREFADMFGNYRYAYIDDLMPRK